MRPVTQAPDGDGFDELDEAWLRARSGEKWSVAGPGVIPCWVADMDYPAPLPVREALRALASGGDLGYPAATDREALERTWAARMERRYGWAPAAGRLRLFTDIVQATDALLYTATSPGDGVLVLTPSYPPFLKAVAEMGRILLPVPAVRAGTGWAFDLDAARQLAAQHGTKALLLVNPHNPTGRVLRRDELLALGEVAERYDLLVVSDEIHADLVLTGARHVPFASLSATLAARTVTLYSASKAYNLGGLRCALGHVGSEVARRQLAALPSHVLGALSTPALAATLAAWSPEGDLWLERCLLRLRANRQLLAEWLAGRAARAGVGGDPPEATYLAWLDFRRAGLGDDPAERLLQGAGVMMSPGRDFGPGGAGFCRLNFATTGILLREILERVDKSLA
jgi:cystathionine beta-lyase